MMGDMSALRTWRESVDITVKEAGDLTGYDEASFIDLENQDPKDIPPMTRAKVARRLGVRIGEIFPVPPLRLSRETVEPSSVRRADRDALAQLVRDIWRCYSPVFWNPEMAGEEPGHLTPDQARLLREVLDEENADV